MFKKGFRYVFMDQATDGTDGGGGAGGGAAEAGAATGDTSGSAATASGTAGGQAGAAGTGDTGGTAGTGAAAAASAAGTTLESGAASPAQIPEKYQVKKEDGSIDIEASSLKLAEAYTNLEKRIGTGDIAPKTVDDYQITVPDQFKDVLDPKADPLLQGFLTKAHAAGYTQKQIDLAMGEYFAIAPQLVAGAQQLSADDCVAQLKTEWKTDEQYKAEVGKAYKAAVGFGGADAQGIIKDHGNDPRIIRLLARVGAEMGEDQSLNPGDQQNGGGDAIATMMASEAYTNPKHPDHARVSEQVRKHFEAQAAKAEKAGNAAIM